MNGKSAFGPLVMIALASTLCAIGGAQEREWKDRTGKFSVTARLVAVEGDYVVLQRHGGKKIRVRMDRLSVEDQKFVRSRRERRARSDGVKALGNALRPKRLGGSANDDIAAIRQTAIRFFEGLRGENRDRARQTLTSVGREQAGKPRSPLNQLPVPADGKRAIQAGRPRIDGTVAEIPVRVRAGGSLHKTKLHLRFEEKEWQVFAISATYPDGEKSINFEAEMAEAERSDPLASLVGKPIELSGYLLDGSPLDMGAFAGKVVLVDFWATWCGPCRAEIPNIAENYQRYHDAGFDVIAISVDRDLDKLRQFVTQERPPWTVVADHHPDNRESMGNKYGIRGIPAFILIGRDGNVAAVNCRGKRLGQELQRRLRSSG